MKKLALCVLLAINGWAYDSGLYSRAASGPPPCVAAPWLSHQVSEGLNGWQLDLNIVNIDPGTFVSTWLMNVPDPVTQTIYVATAPIPLNEIMLRVGVFPGPGGHRYNVKLEFPTANQGHRWQSGTVTLGSNELITVASDALAHIQGQSPVAPGCGFDSVWVGMPLAPTAVIISNATWDRQTSTVSWQTLCEYQTMAFQVLCQGLKGSSKRFTVPGQSEANRGAQYEVRVPTWTRRVKIVEIDTYGQTKVLVDSAMGLITTGAGIQKERATAAE